MFPALAVVEELHNRSGGPSRVLFLTADRPIETRILQELGAEQMALPASDSVQFRKRPGHALRSLAQALSGADRAISGLPHPLILGTGGFGSMPGALAGWWRKRPIVLLEQNVVPGRATSLLCRCADIVCTSFDETAALLPRRCRSRVTGNPVRQSIGGLASREAQRGAGALLVLGGSQGAAAINDAVSRIITASPQTFAGWRVVHQTGERDCRRVADIYRHCGIEAEVAPFFTDMTTLYGCAALVVTRAGATSLAEIACAGIPAVLVPYPGAVRDHQRVNARYYVDRHAAVMVEQTGGTAEFESKLARIVTELMRDESRRREMSRAMHSLARPAAAAAVADIILEMNAGDVRR